MKPRLAVWMPAGIGGGFHSQGVPFIHYLVQDLKQPFNIDVYSMLAPNEGFNPVDYSIFSAPESVRSRWLRWLWLAKQFWGRRELYKVVYALWGYPSGWISVLLAKSLGKRSVVHLQGADSVYLPEVRFGSAKSYFYRLLLRWTYLKATELIVLTGYQQEKVRQLGVNRPIHIIPFGVDLNLFPFEERKSLRKPLRFLHVGNLTAVKDQYNLIRVFAGINKVIPSELRVLGVDHTGGAIQVLSQQLQIEVEFLPVQPHSLISEHYRWADIFLLTSLYEAQCVSAVEAAASGTLVVGTRVGIISDWSGNQAIATAVGDPAQLIQEIRGLISDDSKQNEMRMQARRWAEAHNRFWTAQQIIEVIQSCCKE